MRYDVERGKVVQSLVSGGDLTLLQLKMRTGIGTRTLTDVLYGMIADGAVQQTPVGEKFPRKVVWSLPKGQLYNHLFREQRPRLKNNGRSVEKTITMPIYLHEVVVAEAAEANRSFSAQVVTMLESTLA